MHTHTLIYIHKRYSSSCFIADGVGLSVEKIPFFLKWVNEIMEHQGGGGGGGALRLKGIVYIRGSEESHSSKRKFFSSKGRDPITAVGLLDASKHNSLSWKVIQLCTNEEEEEEVYNDHVVKHGAHSAEEHVPNVAGTNFHCAEASCPLNNISSMTGQYSGDFDLNQMQHCKDTDENTDETILPYETISSHLESKIFIIGKKLPSYTVVMPRFRSFLVPDNFVEIGDEEIEFNGSNCELRINIHGLASSSMLSSSMVSDSIAKEEEEEVEEVLVEKAVVDEKVTFHARAVNNKTKVFQILRMFNGSLYMSTNEM